MGDLGLRVGTTSLPGGSLMETGSAPSPGVSEGAGGAKALGAGSLLRNEGTFLLATPRSGVLGLL